MAQATTLLILLLLEVVTGLDFLETEQSIAELGELQKSQVRFDEGWILYAVAFGDQ